MAAPHTHRIELPCSSPGTGRHIDVLRYGEAGSRPKAYLQAGIHADEIPGMLVLHHLAGLLRNADVSGEIVLVPVANPIGLAQYLHGTLLGRYESGSGINFNRAYPDLAPQAAAMLAAGLGADAATNVAAIRATLTALLDAAAPADEAEFLRIALMQLAIDSDICLDLHCDREAVLHLYLGTPLWPAAADLAAQIGSRTTLLATVSGGNPFDEAIGGVWWSLAPRFADKPIPPACLAATVELRGRADVDDDLARSDARNLLRFLQRRGVVAGEPGPLPEPLCEATPFEGVDVIRSPVAGVVCYARGPGERVRAGETVAHIVDPLGGATVSVASAVDGVLYARRSDRMARPGQILCRVAGPEPLAERVGTHLLSD